MKKLFTSNVFFVLTVVLSVLCMAVYFPLTLIASPESYVHAATCLFAAVCCIALYASYLRHNKNVMKGLMGAILTALLFIALPLVKPSFGAGRMLCSVFALALSVCLFLNHFLINESRASNPFNVGINRVLCLVIAVLLLVFDLCGLPSAESSMEKVALILHGVGFAAIMASIVCVESRLDTYREDRENAGWTEEKGYPKDYKRK